MFSKTVIASFKVGNSNYQWVFKTLIASSATQSRELPVDFEIASSATQSRELPVYPLDCLIGGSK